MGLPSWTTTRRRAAILIAAAVATLLVFLAPATRPAQATSVASVAARLAADTQRLADARADLAETQDSLDALRAEHRILRIEVEGRLVAIYKHGATAGTLTRFVGGESMQDISSSIEMLDQVADNDARLLRRWQRIDHRCTVLTRRAARLKRDIDRSEAAVRAGRERLSAAERVAAIARRETTTMARTRDSLLLPKVGHPENTAVQSADGDDEDAISMTAQPIGFHQSGVASMYSDSFAGERTANGETYDPGAFTAAHPSLPFGTWVTVTGPAGSVSVRINDRGPFVGGRIIDLSRAAAEAIGIRLGSVTLDVAA